MGLYNFCVGFTTIIAVSGITPTLFGAVIIAVIGRLIVVRASLCAIRTVVTVCIVFTMRLSRVFTMIDGIVHVLVQRVGAVDYGE
jgi:hypothetical protein